jgi:HAD superfamily hydrolase (TIGR01509 family)
MRIKIPATVVFDCDGTLVDSEEIHARALEGALAELGVRLTAAQIRSHSAGIANEDYLNLVAAQRGIVLPPAAPRRVEDIAERLIETEIRLIDGADEVVKTLAARGVRLAVASNSCRRLVHQMLRAARLAPMFGDRVATRDDVAEAKPAPDVYRYAAGLLEARAEDCLAVEDSVVGVAAAHAAGMTVVGVRPPVTIFSEAQLFDAGATVVIRSLTEILNWL